MSKITGVICTYDRYDLLPKAIESLQKQTLSRSDYRIMVVDNSPDHAAAAEFSRRYTENKNLTYLVEKRPGLSNARNVSARACETPYIAYMDDDAIASGSWLEKIVEAFEDFGESAGAVGGRVNPIWEVERPNWLHEELLGFLSVVDWGGECRIATEDEWFAGTNMAFRKDDLLADGGFSTSLGRVGGGAMLLSNEESHLIERLKAAGKLIIYAPEAEVDHLVEEKRLNPTWFRRRAAWQSISDYLMDAEKAIAAAKTQWNPIVDYFNSLPPRERTVRGLFFSTDDPELFKRQLDTVYMLTTVMLNGFADAEP